MSVREERGGKKRKKGKHPPVLRSISKKIFKVENRDGGPRCRIERQKYPYICVHREFLCVREKERPVFEGKVR
jgi:hypothetical protein